MRPTISVIIPVYNGAKHLYKCLSSLRNSTVAPLEILVVDDASTDGSSQVARDFGASLISLRERSGPAHARNVASRQASGDILLFLDADVCVDRHSLALIEELFAADRGLDSVIGSYDTAPEDSTFVSSYKNLLHCYTHQISKRQAGTFWTGCGAVRRSVFQRLNGFDESYKRASIEDIEFGLRLAREGGKIELVKELQVKHLKQWSLFRLLRSDILDRAIPWTELILRTGALPDDLNLRLSHRVSALLSGLLLLLCSFEIFKFRQQLLLPLFTLLFLCLGRYWMQSVSLRNGKAINGVVIAMLATMTAIAIPRHALLLPVAACGEYVLLYFREKCLHTLLMRRHCGLLVGGYFLAASCLAVSYVPRDAFVVLFPVTTALLLINARVYLFLARHWGHLFALAAVPLHWLYHLYCGPAFLAGIIIHAARQFRPVPAQSWRAGTAAGSSKRS